MAEPPKFTLSKDLPAWGAAVGTIALAGVAFFTLRPIIENLEIRDRNHELTIENKALDRSIAEQQFELERTQARLDITKLEHEAASKRVEELSRRESQQFESITRITAHIGQLFERQTELQRKAEGLQAEVDRLSADNAALRAANEELGRERAQAEAAVVADQAERDRASAERDAALVLGRRFILDTLVAKLLSVTQVPADPEEAADIRTDLRAKGFFRSVYSYGDIAFPAIKGGGVFRGIKIGVDPADVVGWNLPFLASTIGPSGDTGRELVLAEFSDQSFNILPELARARFQDEIRSYMDENSSLFAAHISIDAEIEQKLLQVSGLARATPGSKYYDENYVAAYRKHYRREPPKADEDPASVDQDVENARDAFRSDQISIYRARAALRESLNRMKDALSGTLATTSEDGAAGSMK